jgi:hypothetical protein
VTDEQQIVALREEIWRAGRDANTMQERGIRWAGILAVAVAVVVGAAVALKGDWRVAWFVGAVSATVVGYLAFHALLVGALATTAPFISWKLHRDRKNFQSRLVALPTEDRAAVLLPLRNDPLARRLAMPLLREFGLPTELSPATAPDARGDEASPAEKER